MYSLIYITIRCPHLFLPMSTIFIEKRTREKLRNIGRKEQTYDDVINELIQKNEASNLNSAGFAEPTKQESK